MTPELRDRPSTGAEAEGAPTAADAGPTVLDRLDDKDAFDIFPAAATRVIRIAGSPTATLDDLERAVSIDPTLSAHLLRIANSGFFALSRSVGSVRDALLMLGFSHTRDLAVALSMSVLGRSERVWERSLWLHLLRVGVACHALGRDTGIASPSELFVCGLLHDMGKLLLLSFDEPRYLAMLVDPAHDLPMQERAAFGADHAELAARVVERWNLPERIVLTVRHHHDEALFTPDGAAALPPEVTLLALADRTAYLAVAHRDEPADVRGARVAEDALVASWSEVVGLPSERIAGLVGSLDEQVSALQMG